MKKINESKVKGIQERSLKRKHKVYIEVRVLDSKDKETGFKTYTIYWFRSNEGKELPKRYEKYIDEKFSDPKTRTHQVYKPSGVIKQISNIQKSFGDSFEVEPTIFEETINFMDELFAESKSKSKSVVYEHELNYYLINLSTKNRVSMDLLDGKTVTDEQKEIRTKVIEIENRINEARDKLNNDYNLLSPATRSVLNRPSVLFVNFNLNRDENHINSCNCMYYGNKYKVKSYSNILTDYKHGEFQGETSIPDRLIFEDKLEIIDNIVFRYPTPDTLKLVRDTVKLLERVISEDSISPYQALKEVTDNAYIKIDRSEVYDSTQDTLRASTTSSSAYNMYPAKSRVKSWYPKELSKVKYYDIKNYLNTLKCNDGRDLNSVLETFKSGIDSFKTLNIRYKNKEFKAISMDINSFYPSVEASMRLPVNLNKVDSSRFESVIRTRRSNFYFFGLFRIDAKIKETSDLYPVYNKKVLNDIYPMDRLSLKTLRKYYDINSLEVIDLWETDLNKSYLSLYKSINDVYKVKKVIDERILEDSYSREEDMLDDEKNRSRVKSILNTHIGVFGKVSNYNLDIKGVDNSGRFLVNWGEPTYECLIYYFAIHFKIMQDFVDRYERIKTLGMNIVHLNVDSFVLDCTGVDLESLPADLRTSVDLGGYKTEIFDNMVFIDHGTYIAGDSEDNLVEHKCSGYNGKFFDDKKYSEVKKVFKKGLVLDDFIVKGERTTYKIGDGKKNLETRGHELVSDRRTTELTMRRLDYQEETKDYEGLTISQDLLNKLDF